MLSTCSKVSIVYLTSGECSGPTKDLIETRKSSNGRSRSILRRIFVHQSRAMIGKLRYGSKSRNLLTRTIIIIRTEKVQYSLHELVEVVSSLTAEILCSVGCL